MMKPAILKGTQPCATVIGRLGYLCCQGTTENRERFCPGVGRGSDRLKSGEAYHQPLAALGVEVHLHPGSGTTALEVDYQPLAKLGVTHALAQRQTGVGYLRLAQTGAGKQRSTLAAVVGAAHVGVESNLFDQLPGNLLDEA